MEQTKFVFQENQFFGEVKACTPSVFNKIIDSSDVARKINTRRSVDDAIRDGSWEKKAAGRYRNEITKPVNK